MSKRLTTEDFITKANHVHSGHYDYSKTHYTRNCERVTIICPIHGEFTQIAASHLKGSGCSRCADNQMAQTKSYSREEILVKARMIHGDRFDYSKVQFVSTLDPVVITCRRHGDFLQTLNNHIHQKSGCRKCNKAGMTSKLEDEWFVASGLSVNRLHRIGKFVVDGCDVTKQIIYEFLGDYWHGYKLFEHNTTVDRSGINLYMATFSRFNELSKLGYVVKYVWEHEWKSAKKNQSLPQLHTFQPWEDN